MKTWVVGLVALLLISTAPAIKAEVTGQQTEWNKGTTQITALGQNGKKLWQRRLNNPLYQNKKSWGVAGNIVWVTIGRGEIAYRGDNLGFRLRDGKKIWDIVGVASPLMATGTELLFQWRDGTNAYPDLRQVELVAVRAATGQQRRLRLSLPQRPGCGDVNQYGFTVGTRADARYVYVRREDKCGVFTARYDWHGAEGQLPVMTPQR